MDTNTIDILLGQKIKTARKAKDISQGDLAKLVGCDRPTITNIESGKRKVSAAEMLLFANALNKPITFFYEGIEDDTKRVYYEVDNGDYGVVMPLNEIVSYIQNEEADAKPEDDNREYIIQPRWLTDEEFSQLPQVN